MSKASSYATKEEGSTSTARVGARSESIAGDMVFQTMASNFQLSALEKRKYSENLKSQIKSLEVTIMDQKADIDSLSRRVHEAQMESAELRKELARTSSEKGKTNGEKRSEKGRSPGRSPARGEEKRREEERRGEERRDREDERDSEEKEREVVLCLDEIENLMKDLLEGEKSELRQNLISVVIGRTAFARRKLRTDTSETSGEKERLHQYLTRENKKLTEENYYLHQELRSANSRREQSEESDSSTVSGEDSPISVKKSSKKKKKMRDQSTQAETANLLDKKFSASYSDASPDKKLLEALEKELHEERARANELRITGFNRDREIKNLSQRVAEMGEELRTRPDKQTVQEWRNFTLSVEKQVELLTQQKLEAENLLRHVKAERSHEENLFIKNFCDQREKDFTHCRKEIDTMMAEIIQLGELLSKSETYY